VAGNNPGRPQNPQANSRERSQPAGAVPGARGQPGLRYAQHPPLLAPVRRSGRNRNREERAPGGLGIQYGGQQGWVYARKANLKHPQAPLRGFNLEKKPGRQVGMGKCREGSEFSTVASREGFMPGSPTWANRGAPSGLHFREKKN